MLYLSTFHSQPLPSSNTPSRTSQPHSFPLTYIVMPGPTRRRNTTNNRHDPLQPPRPPNAWILYRSDKLKEIEPPAPGESRRTQADMSKLLSEMWKQETPEVRARYEQLSKVKKAEHQEKYPDYQFRPMKREDKEQLRIEKREKKKEQQDRKGKGRAHHSNSQVPPPLLKTNAHFPVPATMSTLDTRFPLTHDPFPEAGPSSLPWTPFNQPEPSFPLPEPSFPLPEPLPTTSTGLLSAQNLTNGVQDLKANGFELPVYFGNDPYVCYTVFCIYFF